MFVAETARFGLYANGTRTQSGDFAVELKNRSLRSSTVVRWGRKYR